MIPVFLNEMKYEYDIHSLVKAFFPSEDVKVVPEETRNETALTEWGFLVQFDSDRISVCCMRPEQTDVKKTCPVLDIDRIAVKNCLKGLLYHLLAEVTGRKLPWGDLTGIRPTKIPLALLEQGKNEDEIRSFMKDSYFVSPEKIDLSIEIAKREQKILAPIHYEKGYSLYIGIPFCPTTCLYCSFTSYPIVSYKKRVSEYLDALEREMEFTSKIYQNKILDTVYIGGGTPTTLEPDELHRLLSSIEHYFDLSQVKEFTVESGRPDSITLDKLLVLKQHGITRISINPQTMKDETLKIIGRHHTVEQTLDAFSLARNAGMENINMDLIMGLPGETIEDVAHTLDVVKTLRPESLTVHSLAVKRASHLNEWMEKNGRDSMHNTPEMMNLCERAAREMNLLPYYLYRQKNMAGNFENVGYAKEDMFGLYNILIMEEKQTIIALGAGTITKRVYLDGRIERCDNVKDVALYIEKIDEMIDRKKKLLNNTCSG